MNLIFQFVINRIPCFVIVILIIVVAPLKPVSVSKCCASHIHFS